MIKSYDEIDRILKETPAAELKTIAVAAAGEAHVLKAVCDAKALGLADAILIGDEETIRNVASENGLDISSFRIIDINDAEEAAKVAVQLVRKGDADLVMKGLLNTSVFLRAILDKEKGLRKSDLLSVVAIFEMEGYDRLIYMTDPAINIQPTMEEKEIIMKNAVGVAHALGNPCPKVAFVAPVETVNPKLESTVHAKSIAEKYAHSKDFTVGGPFGLDNAISVEAAMIKGIEGPVAGQADILVLNDLGAANVLYKSLTCFANAHCASVTVGAAAPVVMSSRADSSDTKLNSIKIAIMMAG